MCNSIIINGREYSVTVINSFKESWQLIECRGFQYGSYGSQLHDITYHLRPVDEYYGEQSNLMSQEGYGCCYSSSDSWTYVAKQLNISVEQLIIKALQIRVPYNKVVASKTLGRYWDGYEATDSNTPLKCCI